MSKRKQTSHAGHSELVHEARAGLIPASDDIADEQRARLDCAARIIGSAKPYLGSGKRVSDRHAITSILADLRHYCDGKGLVFGKLGTAAYALYLLEKADGTA
jgi:hypothetical protein